MPERGITAGLNSREKKLVASGKEIGAAHGRDVDKEGGEKLKSDRDGGLHLLQKRYRRVRRKKRGKRTPLGATKSRRRKRESRVDRRVSRRRGRDARKRAIMSPAFEPREGKDLERTREKGSKVRGSRSRLAGGTTKGAGRALDRPLSTEGSRGKGKISETLKEQHHETKGDSQHTRWGEV